MGILFYLISGIEVLGIMKAATDSGHLLVFLRRPLRWQYFLRKIVRTYSPELRDSIVLTFCTGNKEGKFNIWIIIITHGDLPIFPLTIPSVSTYSSFIFFFSSNEKEDKSK